MTDNTWQPAGGVPEPQLVQRLLRRPAAAEYKLRILREADECSTRSELGALLRRESLYVSHLTHWRAQHEAGILERSRHRRGGKPPDRRDVELADLRHRLEQLKAELDTARDVIAIHLELSAMLDQLASPRFRRGETAVSRG
jgi:hypothetical protein